MNEGQQTQNKPTTWKFIVAAVFVILGIAALVSMFLSWEPKPDPASEAVIRRAAAQPGKDTGKLTDEDLAQITDLSVNVKELADIELLKKFTNLKVLILSDISYKKIKIPKWRAILAKYGIVKSEQNYLIDLKPLEKLIHLERLHLTTIPVKNINSLARLSNLRELRLSRTQVSDIEPLRRLTNLQELWLNDTKIKDIEPLKEMVNLQILALGITHVSNLEPIKEFKNLQILYLDDTTVSDLEPLGELTNLKILYLNNTRVSDLEPLNKLHTLETLNITGAKVSSLEHIKNLTNIKKLYINDTQASDLELIKGFKSLRVLWIISPQISIPGYDFLENPEFGFISFIESPQITDEQIEELKEALPFLAKPARDYLLYK